MPRCCSNYGSVIIIPGVKRQEINHILVCLSFSVFISLFLILSVRLFGIAAVSVISTLLIVSPPPPMRPQMPSSSGG